jgi:cytochrome c553
MKKTILLSLAAATLLFTGCSEETKKAATETATAAKETTQSAAKDVQEAAQKAVEATKEATAPMVETAKEKTAQAVESAKEAAAPVVEAAKAKVVEAADAVKEAAAPAVETVEEKVMEATEAVAVDTEAGKAVYAKCTSCHGADGNTPALGKSVAISGQSAAELETKLLEYKAGTRDVAGMGTLMKAQVAAMSDEDIKAVSAYIATF